MEHNSTFKILDFFKSQIEAFHLAHLESIRKGDAEIMNEIIQTTYILVCIRTLKRLSMIHPTICWWQTLSSQSTQWSWLQWCWWRMIMAVFVSDNIEILVTNMTCRRPILYTEKVTNMTKMSKYSDSVTNWKPST